MKITQDPKILDILKEYIISYHPKPSQSKIPSPTNRESRRGRIGETWGKRNVEEGSHQKSSTIKREVCKQLIPCKKDGLGPRTTDKFEATEQLNPYISHCHFRMEDLQNLKYMLQ